MTSTGAQGGTPSTEGRRSRSSFDVDVIPHLEQLDGIDPDDTSEQQREGLAISEANHVARQLGEHDGGVKVPWYVGGQSRQSDVQATDRLGQQLDDTVEPKKSPPKEKDLQRRGSWEAGDDAPGALDFKYKGG